MPRSPEIRTYVEGWVCLSCGKVVIGVAGSIRGARDMARSCPKCSDIENNSTKGKKGG